MLPVPDIITTKNDAVSRCRNFGSPSLLVPCNPMTSQPFAAQVLSRVSMWPIPLTPLTAAVRTLNVSNVRSSSRDLALAALCFLRADFLSPRFPRRFFPSKYPPFFTQFRVIAFVLPTCWVRHSASSESSSSSFSEQATLAQFASPGKFHVPNESVVGDVTVPGSYLHSAFVVHSGSSEDDVWIADSGASCHMTHDRTRTYNVRPPPPGSETITIGDRRRIK